MKEKDEPMEEELMEEDDNSESKIKKKEKDKNNKSQTKLIILIIVSISILIFSFIFFKKKFIKTIKTPNPNNVVLCPFDNGIRVMQQFDRGVYGTANAPKEIFKQLFGDIQPLNQIPGLEQLNKGINEDSYRAHDLITAYIEKFKKPFVVLGGDHSITFPIVRGLVRQSENKNKKFGLIYFDAHYDMRPLEGELKNILSSGNSFYRILTDKEVKKYIKGENMVVIGIKKGDSEIFQFMSKMAKDNKMTTIYLDDINENNYLDIMKKALEIAGKNTDGIYLSFDTDVLDKKYVPGASCPAEKGLELELAKKMVNLGEFVGVDIVETSNREKSYKGEVDEKGNEKLIISAKSDTEIIKNIRLKKLD